MALGERENGEERMRLCASEDISLGEILPRISDAYRRFLDVYTDYRVFLPPSTVPE